jgi:hypothetical protein
LLSQSEFFYFSNIFITLLIVLKRRKVRILKKALNITFFNPNTEEQIVQAFAGVLAYNLAENNKNIKFDYTNVNTFQNSHNAKNELER